MKSIPIDKKNTITVILWSGIILLAFYPPYFEFLPVVSKLDVLINMLITVGVVFYITHYKKTNIGLLSCAFFIFLQCLSTFWNQAYISNALWGRGVLLFVLCGGIQWAYSSNERLFLKTSYILFYFLVVVNFFTILIFPGGMIEDQRGIKGTNFFLGNYNQFIIYISIPLITGYLYLKNFGKKYSKLWYVMLWMISFMTYSIATSTNSLIGLSLLAVYMLCLNHTWTKVFLNLKVYIFCNILFFIFFVWNTSESNVLLNFVSMLGKDITFTGRTEIWNQVLKLMSGHWILGYGIESGPVMAEKVGMLQAVNAHNLYLDILYKTGLLGISAMMLSFLYMIYCIHKIQDSKIKNFVEAFIGILMLLCQFEAYNIKFIFFVMILFTVYANKHAKQGGNYIENKIYHL